MLQKREARAFLTELGCWHRLTLFPQLIFCQHVLLCQLCSSTLFDVNFCMLTTLIHNVHLQLCLHRSWIVNTTLFILNFVFSTADGRLSTHVSLSTLFGVNFICWQHCSFSTLFSAQSNRWKIVNTCFSVNPSPKLIPVAFLLGQVATQVATQPTTSEVRHRDSSEELASQVQSD